MIDFEIDTAMQIETPNTQGRTVEFTFDVASIGLSGHGMLLPVDVVDPVSKGV